MIAAIGAAAVVSVQADAMAPMADEHDHGEHDHGEHDHDAMVEGLKAIGYKGYMATDYIPEAGADAVAVRVPLPYTLCCWSSSHFKRKHV